MQSRNEARMNATMESPTVDIHDVAIDHVNVTQKKSGGVHDLVALTPLLTVLITAIGLVFTFCFNIFQNHTTARQKVDSDWREALAKGIDDENSAALVALEMETFATDPVYGKHAKSIMYSVLPAIKSEMEFDTAFIGVLDSATDEDEEALVSVVARLSLELERQHDIALKAMTKGTPPADTSLASFVLHPDAFLPDDSPALAEANRLTWKLDTASAGLSGLWRGSKTRKPLRPGGTDLSGLIFLNHDFTGVDFSQTSMKDSFFVGNCKINATVPKTATVACAAH